MGGNSRGECDIMAGKIHRYDCYDLRKFDPEDIGLFLDIGANVGTTAIMARILNPRARIIALEPCKETFDILHRNMFYWQTECYNVAYGSGTPMCFVPQRSTGTHRFVTDSDEEKQWWKDTYTVESKTLTQMFEEYKISTKDNYIIKMDCEGGERFLLEEKKAWGLIRGSVQTIFELHLSFGGTSQQWNGWFKQFRDTHELCMGQWIDKETPKCRYVYVPCEGLSSSRGRHQIGLIDKEWVRKRG